MRTILTARWDDQARNAYFRRAKRDGVSRDQPASKPDVYVDDVSNRFFVALHNRHGLLAVYSVRSGDRLHELTRWPKAIQRHYEG